MADGAPATLYGIPLKLVALLTLTVQNSALILVMHYSRVKPSAAGVYYASTAVLLNEIVKLITCSAVSLKLEGFRDTKLQVLGPDCLKMAIPAALYTLQNSLQYTAVSNLSAASFQVTYQLKILTTAFFSVLMLHRVLAKTQWISLVLLTLGIAIVQVDSNTVVIYTQYFVSWYKGAAFEWPAADAQQEHAGASQALGLIAVTLACLISGLAGVYFEKVLKGAKSSLWIRNIQLSGFSIVPALLIGVLWKDGQGVAEHGFFHGYNFVVWLAVFLQAFGGIVVAVCVKYADNIAKNFATSISILLSSVASIFLFNFNMSVPFMVGAGLVIYATFLYSRPAPVKEDIKA